MKRIPITKNKLSLVDDADFDRVSSIKWHLCNGYAAGRPDGVFTYLHRFIMNPGKGLEVDHDNLDKLDNRRENLRICLPRFNKRNAPMYRNNKSGYKGVTRHSNLWRATIVVDKKQHSLGYFNKIIDAAKAYNEAAIHYHGEFARINKLET